ncbi:hypothetical protein B8W72_17580 [Pseudomonas putida]|uniref:Uncharacterized protein n=1 Tax=Pseudomonas putida TaxID=303 RepID=A0A1Y3KVM7_PSEPU|nr:hypothetical protein [Pseudomonas putida]OUM29927.1 hypothetical protein B8W72_17580 [Pseudomonas putida]
MNTDELVNIIKNVANEQDYEVTDGNRKFEVFIDRHNAVAFEVFANTSSGYIQIHQWEESLNGYGRGVYSLRNYTDVVHFCNIMTASANIRARRREQ